MARVLLTGATGFIGRALAPALTARGYDVIAPARAQIGEIDAKTDWARVLEGVQSVVHLAGLAHKHHSEADLMRVNAEGAQRLAEQAARAGAGVFVLMSSVKAAADRTAEQPLPEDDTPAPGTPYGRSKLAGERAVSAVSGMKSVALRPPLVHAPEARANFAALLRLAASPAPLPFADARNRRSVIARQSLIDAVLAVLGRSDAPAGAYYVADRPALSTGQMLAALRRGLGRSANLFPGAALARLAPAVLRESLEIDDNKFRTAFAFQGQDSSAALAATAAAWKTRSR